MRPTKIMLALLLILPMALFSVSGIARADQTDLRIARIVPSGEDIADGRQIVITFNRPVVPLGRMERDPSEIPVSITPAIDCAWRWINTESLACQLGEKAALKKSTRYDITVSPGLAAEDGATIPEPYKAHFITRRADVDYSWFKTWRGPAMPVIRLVFNQPVTKTSAEKALSFRHDGATTSLSLYPDEDDSELPSFVPYDKGWLSFGVQEKRKSDDRKTEKDGEEARRIWLAEPAEELPIDTKVSLKLEAGLVSAEGPETSVMARDIVTFDTYPALALLGVSCITNDNVEILIPPGDGAEKRKCDPLAPVSVAFSAPVLRSEVRDHFTFSPAMGAKSAAESVWGDLSYQYSYLHQPHEKGRIYKANLPYGLKAEQQYTAAVGKPEMGFWARLWLRIKSLFVDMPETEIEDEFARKLEKGGRVVFSTDRRKPNFELDHRTAVLEKNADSDVPLYVNNLERVDFSYRRVTATESAETKILSRTPPHVDNVQFAVPFGVREALDGKTGAVYGTLSTTPAVDKGDWSRRLFAVVTPWQVHVKLGHFSSLAWVTDLASGQAVGSAKVTLYKDALSTLSPPQAPLADAVTDADGIATLPGSAEIDPDLDLHRGWDDSSPKIFARIEKDGDIALMPLNQDFSIDIWRASNEHVRASTRKEYGHLLSWGTTAQGIYRAGDTMDYKIYVRHQNDLTLTQAPREGYKLEIVDPAGKAAHTVEKVEMNAFGAFSGQFTVPENAVTGWYEFRLTAAFSREDEPEYDEYSGESTARNVLRPMRVLVSDFTPAPFRVENQLNGDLFAPETEIVAQTFARMHAGGPYTGASARTTALLTERPFTSKHPRAAGFSFTPPDSGISGSRQIFQGTSPLDAKGEAAAAFRLEAQPFAYGLLEVESAVMDDRGKYVAAQGRATFAGADRYVGVKSPSWAYEAKKPVSLQYIVVDEKGAPAAGTAVHIDLERRETVAARVKGAGNAYLTHYTSEWVKTGSCEGTSQQDALTCDFTPDKAGSYRAVAKISDTQGRSHAAGTGFWVTGGDYVLWDNGSDVLLPIIPEQAEYRVGDTARFLVKNPYPGATALVTVERYGIVDRFARKLDGSTPVLEIPVKADYLPGFYLSVTVVSPRVAGTAPDTAEVGQLDLGKPAFRIGYLTVPVRDKHKEMTVTAKADAEVYRPGDKVRVRLHAEPRVAGRKEPVELAVAVLDESVLDLIAEGAGAFDPYAGFYALDGLDLRNYSLLTRLIGRQKFEKKGANPGGDGGAALKIRDLFKFVAYWNPSLQADAGGNAEIAFEVPDNLTGWRVLALAVTPTDRLGLGQTSFKVNRPTEVRPVMPNQVTERDSFKAGFSVMNRTDKPRRISVRIDAEGTIAADGGKVSHEETVELAAYARASVFMPVVAATLPETADLSKGSIVFNARAWDDTDADGMAVPLDVRKFRSLETAAQYGTTEDATTSQSIAFPKTMFPDIGSVSVVLSPSVLGALEGAFRYMRDYPYLCWEQILTKGVMAAHYLELKKYMRDGFGWEGADTLPASALQASARFQAPNGGMSYFIPQDDYADPYLSAYTALAFNWLRSDGYDIPAAAEEKLHGYLLNLLRNDTAPTFYDEGMRSTVRAVALAALAAHGKVSGDDIDRYLPHLKQMSLFGKAHFLQAALRIGGKEKVAAEIADDILSHSNQSAGKFVFSEELDDSYLRLLSSPLRENCAILDTLVAYAQTPDGAGKTGDIPFKLARTVTQTRQNREHWENTQENMFCMNALASYSRVYEKTKPDMTVTTSLDGRPFGKTSFRDLRDASVTLERPIVPEDAGRTSTIEIAREGQGRLYYATRLRYAPRADFATPVNAGMELKREYSVERNGKWELLQPKDTVSRGEIVRVDLYLSLPAARNFVVVNDPVPGGLEPVNSDLATASRVDAGKGDFTAAGGSWFFKFSDWQGYNVSRWSFYHRELRHDSARFYSDYLPPGNYHLSYTAQAVAEGQFTAQPPLAEEMYDPDVFGKDIVRELAVKAAE